jgi:hypothetical protein
MFTGDFWWISCAYQMIVGLKKSDNLFLFIESTKRAVKSKIEIASFWIIPGDRGKAGSG